MQTESIYSEYVFPYFYIGLNTTGVFMVKNNIKICTDYAIIKIAQNNKIYDCLIDIEDIEKIKDYHWRLRFDKRHPKCTPYVETFKQINKKHTRIHLHRFLMNCPTGLVVDHINHNNLDNRKSNLRICTQSLNSLNKKETKNIYYIPRDDLYVVCFVVNGKRKKLCYTRDIKEAEYYQQIGKKFIKENKLDNLLKMPCHKILLPRNNTSGFLGISLTKNNTYRVSYKNKYISTVKTLKEAISLRKSYQLQNNF